MDIIKRLRNNLQPQGTAPVVQLHIAGYGMFNSDLEKLAYQLLLDSAHIDLKHEREREQWLKENT